MGTHPDTSLEERSVGQVHRLWQRAVNPHERMWDTIGAIDPRGASSAWRQRLHRRPRHRDRLHYYRRHGQMDKLAKKVPIYAIWDDHDFTTNDGWGSPAIEDELEKQRYGKSSRTIGTTPTTEEAKNNPVAGLISGLAKSTSS